MPDATFRTLVLDAGDAVAIADFWSRATASALRSESGAGGGLVVELLPDGDGRGEGLWVDPVPEPRVGPGRVRIDVQLPDHDPAPLTAAGARVLSDPSDGAQWWVLEDPEGNVFRAMPPPPPELHVPYVHVPTVYELVVEAADPESQARWWAQRTGGTARSRPLASFWWVDGAAGFPWMFWMFVPETAPKSVKNRLHWDVYLGGETPEPLIDSGATLVRAPDDDITWWVLADPEGNEFCAFPASAGP